MTNSNRHAFFLYHLAQVLNESQVAEIRSRAHTSINYKEIVPKLSERQQEVHDWLCKDEFAKAADERLVKERDLAVTKYEETQYGDREARQLASELKIVCSDLRRQKTRISESFEIMESLLNKVPEPFGR